MRIGLPRRKRLMLIYTLSGLSLVAVASAAFLLTREEKSAYIPGQPVEGITDSLDRPAPAGPPPTHFVEVARQSGIDFRHFQGTRSTQLPEDMGSGAAWGDYDGDGRVDLYVSNLSGPLGQHPGTAHNHLYHNNGDGTFADTTEAAGVGFRGWSMGAAWGDYDGDGRLDLWVTNYGHNLLYHNNGDGTFTDVSRAARVAGPQGFWTGVSWADYDGDGDLDAYVCGYVRYHFKPEDLARATLQYRATVPFTLNPSSYAPQRNLLFRNNGNGTFTEVAARLGVANPGGRSLSASWADFDGDGHTDLYVANDISDNVFFRNLGGGRFQEISHQVWVSDYRGAMGLAVGDWDNDGDFDLFITHWIAQENALFTNLMFAFDHPRQPSRMVFMDTADQVGLGQIALDYVGWGTSFFDFDNDGRLDLLAVNGSTFQQEKDPHRLVPMRSLLFWNRGPEDGFYEIGQESGPYFSQEWVGRGAAFADYDDDGDIDVFIVNHGARAALLRNDLGQGHHWCKVRVRARGGNRFGVGARVEVWTSGGHQLRQIGSQSSYLSQNALEAHFGLGKAREIDRLKVTFPDGRALERHNLGVDQTFTLVEPR